jgi:hypothetical protein
MSEFCARTAGLVERRREDRLSSGERADLETHLADCPACRHEAALTEPLALFSELTRRPLPPVTASYILGGLRVEEHRRAPRRWRLGAFLIPEPLPMLVSLLALAALVVFWAFQGGPARVGPGPDAMLRSSLDRFEPGLAPHAMTTAVETVEDIRSTTAEIFAFSMPGESGPTEVILIVDRSIDL